MNETYVLPNGLEIYGSPYQPEFHDWAFNLERCGSEAEEIWASIPSSTDILVTHGPPYQYGDMTSNVSLRGETKGTHVGCEILHREVCERVRPKVHIFGHIHEDAGVFYEQIPTNELNTTIDNTNNNNQTITSLSPIAFINASTCNFFYKPHNPPIVFDIEDDGTVQFISQEAWEYHEEENEEENEEQKQT